MRTRLWGAGPDPGAAARAGDGFGAEPLRPLIRRLLAWILLLASAVVLLSGRYDFTPEAWRYSWQGFLSSAYLLVIFLPTLYYLLRTFCQRILWVRAVTAGVGLLFTLPYRWLGLDRFFYHRDRPSHWPIVEPPSLEWLPEALSGPSSIPHELLVFSILATLGSVAAVVAARRGDGQHKAAALLWLGLYGLILLQSWLHLSMRNPGVYTTHLARHEKHAENDYFSLTYLFEDAQGAASRDYVLYRSIEEHFMGLPKETHTMLIRRCFPLYLSSQLSYFTSPFYVSLALNSSLWFLACLCAYYFARPLRGPSFAAYFAFLIACSPGFIAFSTSPRTYLAGYAVIMILIYLFDALVVAKRAENVSNVVLFGCLSGFGMLVYDIFSFYVCFFGLALLKRLPALRVLASFAISFGIYFGFLFLQFSILDLEANTKNSRYLGESFAKICALVFGGDFGEIYIRSATLPAVFVGDLSQGFLVAPLLLAVGGAFLLKDRPQIALALLLGLPVVLNIAFLHYGQAIFGGKEMAKLPRIAFTGYPAVYFLSAVTLDELRQVVASGRGATWARSAPWIVLAGILALNNLDVLGHPETYYLFMKYLGMLPVTE